jgi:hypothetical protein
MVNGNGSSGFSSTWPIRKAIKGNNFAKCAVETALLDPWGKRVAARSIRVRCRRPVYSLGFPAGGRLRQIGSE